MGKDSMDMEYKNQYQNKADGFDEIKKARHYNQGGIETIDLIDLTVESMESFCVGNVIKYIARYKHKGNELKDLLKAEYYLKKTIDLYKGENNGIN